MSHYTVTPDAKVYVVASAKQANALAASIEGSVLATDKDLTNVSSKLLVLLHNRINPEKPITKFSDRATAEKRMVGVLDALAQKPTAKMMEEILPTPTGTPTSPMTEKAKKEPKEPKAKKEPKEKKEREAKKEISEETLTRVIALRKEGKSWSDVVHELGESTNFIHRVRPILRQRDASLVKNLGPGSETYGKRKSGELPATRASRRSTRENTTPTMEF